MIDFDSLPRDSQRKTVENITLPATEWPFKKMAVNEVIVIDDFMGRTKTQVIRMAHNYGNSCKKKFRCKTSGGVLYVKRIK